MPGRGQSRMADERARKDRRVLRSKSSLGTTPPLEADAGSVARARSPRTVFLVPRRRDFGHRDALWVYCRARWEALFPEIPIFEGHHDDGPFNRSMAVNRAAELAGDWDLAIVIDSDVMLSKSQAEAAIARATETGKVTWGHRRWRGIREDFARRIIADNQDLGPEFEAVDMDVLVERTNPISWSCFQVIPRAVWDDVGGFDERFVGWGYEDMAWQSLIVGLYGHERIEGDVIHLWHERSEERITKGQPATTASPEYHRNARLGRRYMVATRRLGFHDRPTESDAAEMERDIANLIRDDEKVALRQTSQDRRQFDGWWPTLEELRDGAKAAKGLATASVALVVRTGGEPDRWEERSRYLRESMASLAEHVTGQFTQRVIYSDWGPAHRAELDDLAAEYGFYVVGPRTHLGYPGAMQELWGYLDRRVRAEFVFAVEDDFRYEKPVDLGPMVDTLREQPHLRQIALLRAAAYPREFEAGGVIESLKTPVELRNHRPYPFLEHRDHWTANPSLFRRSLVKNPWPGGENTERRFGDALLRDKEAAFAYWGSGEPWITHIGTVRAAEVY